MDGGGGLWVGLAEAGLAVGGMGVRFGSLVLDEKEQEILRRCGTGRGRTTCVRRLWHKAL